LDSISAFPKIYAIGKTEIENLFKGEVEVTEKIDGSQFAFGLNSSGELVLRSKGQILYTTTSNMFSLIIQHLNANIDHIKRVLTPNEYIYGEFLNKPKHNVLNYERVPNNYFMVFGVKKGLNFINDYDIIRTYADKLGFETVPLIYKGIITSAEQVQELIGTTISVLGREVIEGVVVKNYNQHTSIGDPTICMGKYVREAFKERHGLDWKAHGNELEDWMKSFKSEARWQKAVIHLKERGELENSPKDIGKLMKEINMDILQEETEEIKAFLHKYYIDKIKRIACAGAAEWYKEQLLKSAFPAEFNGMATTNDTSDGCIRVS